MAESTPLKQDDAGKNQQYTEADDAQVRKLIEDLNDIVIVTKDPQEMVCPSCNYKGVSEVEFRTGKCNYLSCILCCLFGCCLGCCLIPFCIKDCKDAVHKCRQCHADIVTAGVSSKKKKAESS
eukprot:CAMPEP_0204900708 /NCGR_PEP_ID=MMETSP1397-20131031/2637_1 /ASSEMBLY_ACC=CAM_ASM_000891 /TAXON_ID=49980 /ORGANISM="Climacostomum Climacostomum virens, Strain Stock W-24" /LENGTH=122 /DNA_ID=CAMNT_0052068913 /DNA_START=10 /DNA_END=378 /DNA_ORIENTATION=+